MRHVSTLRPATPDRNIITYPQNQYATCAEGPLEVHFVENASG